MPFNPFNGSDGPNLEQGNPIGNTVKKAATAVTAQAVQQAQAAKQSFVDQLYGISSPTGEETDQLGETGPQQTNPLQQTAGHGSSANPLAKTSSEQQQIEETRKKLMELQGQHKKYYDTTFGEDAQKKRQQEEEQARQLKEQEEQEEEERKAQEKARMDEEMQGLQAGGKGKGNGRNRMGPPIAVTNAKTKTEINRGASG